MCRLNEAFVILNVEVQRARLELRMVKFKAGETGTAEQYLVH